MPCEVCGGVGWISIEGIPGVTGGCCFVCNKDGKNAPKPPSDVKRKTVTCVKTNGVNL